MVRTCCVYKCHNRDDAKGKLKGLSFFRFPKESHKRKLWIRAINRANFTPNEHTCICSEHFVSGWHSYDHTDVNYVPTLFTYKEVPCDPERHDRSKRRNLQKEFDDNKEQQKKLEEKSKEFSLFSHSYCKAEEIEEEKYTNSEHMETEDDIETMICFNDMGVQCDPDPLILENQRLKAEVSTLRAELQHHRWSIDKIKDDEGMTKFYTGLASFSVFLWLYNYLSAKLDRMVYWRGAAGTRTERTRGSTACTLAPIDQLLATLMRLRLGLYIQDIADRFGVSVGTYSQYFTTWMCLLYEELKPLNVFPSRDVISKNMPLCFVKYPNLRVIIDCTEIFVQRSSSLVNQNLTFSHYKHHNTLKFLVGITPSGIISFVSEAYGGRISDRQITIESGLLELLEPGDSIMADKGFTISDLLQKKNCTLNIPPFLSGLNQFTTEDVLKTQEIAELRIHVERAIGRVKNFHIFDGVLPLSLAGMASKIFQVCCWLTNLDVPLVENKIVSQKSVSLTGA